MCFNTWVGNSKYYVTIQFWIKKQCLAIPLLGPHSLGY